MLPIKTKKGEVVTRSTEVEFNDENSQQNGNEMNGDEDDENAEQEVVDSDDEVLNDTNVKRFSWQSLWGNRHC